MLPILLKTLPFFALIGLGYWAGRVRFFTPEATAYLTKFVFYFALSAMLFRFAANLSLSEVFSWRFVFAYLLGCVVVYAIAMAVSPVAAGSRLEEAAVEAQCAVIGNTGFLGRADAGGAAGAQAAVGPVLLVLAIDLIVFSSLITLVITGVREGRMSLGIFRVLGTGLLANPMIVSMVLGLAWSATGLAMPAPVNEFLAHPGRGGDAGGAVRHRRVAGDRNRRSGWRWRAG